MRIFKKISFLAVLFGILILNSTCTKQKWFKKVTYEGHVYDKNGNPAKGIEVKLEACGGGSGDSQVSCPNKKFTIGTVYTDETGHFYIHEREARTDFYFVSYNGFGWNSDGVHVSELTSASFTQLHLY